MKQILALAFKDLKLARRDRVGFFFMFIFPLLNAVFFGSIFAGQNESGPMAQTRVAVVDLDHTNASRAFIDDLNTGGDLELSDADSADAAASQVLNARADAYIQIEPGFAESLARPFWGDPAAIKVVIDPSKRASGEMLRGLVMQKAFAQLQNSFTDQDTMQSSAREGLASLNTDPEIPPLTKAALTGVLTALDNFWEVAPAEEGGEGNPMASWEPMTVTLDTVQRPKTNKDTPDNAYAVTFPQGMVWGVLAAAATFAISLVVERTQGTLLRLKASPLGWTRILAGKALACAITIMFVLTLLAVIARVVFAVEPVSVPFLIVSMLCATACFVGIMMLLSVIGRTEAAVGGMSWAVLLIFAMFGGAMIPTFIMPKWMQGVSLMSPIRWAIDAFEGAIWRGLPLSSMAIKWLVLLAIGIACFTLGTVIFRKLDSASA